jgi:hypothetical protein
MESADENSAAGRLVDIQQTEWDDEMNTETKPKNARPTATLRKCPRCRAEALCMSGVYGVREQILFLFWALHYRCRKCQTRHAQMGSLTIRLGDPRKDKTPHVVVAAIVSGLITCTAIILWTLRRAHRWPF